jgi:hypothetical protein
VVVAAGSISVYPMIVRGLIAGAFPFRVRIPDEAQAAAILT